MPITWGTTSNVRFFPSWPEPGGLNVSFVSSDTAKHFFAPNKVLFHISGIISEIISDFSEILANIISEIISAEGHLPDWSLWLNLTQQADTCWVQK